MDPFWARRKLRARILSNSGNLQSHLLPERPARKRSREKPPKRGNRHREPAGKATIIIQRRSGVTVQDGQGAQMLTANTNAVATPG